MKNKLMKHGVTYVTCFDRAPKLETFLTPSQFSKIVENLRNWTRGVRCYVEDNDTGKILAVANINGVMKALVKTKKDQTLLIYAYMYTGEYRAYYYFPECEGIGAVAFDAMTYYEMENKTKRLNTCLSFAR